MISEKINQYLSELPSNVKLVAVSKTKPNELIMEAYNSGYKVFGENKVQDLENKYEELPKDIEWHFIGHLQSNKIRKIAPFVSLIHAVDSFKLLERINKEASKIDRTINCLFQIHIADEDTKFGLSKKEVVSIIESEIFNSFNNINICGLMGMATLSDDKEKVSQEFKYLADLHKELKQNHFSNNPYFKEISMGMSNDYKLAIAEGSTIVRIGSSIFGARNY